MITKDFIQSRGEASPLILCMRSLHSKPSVFLMCCVGVSGSLLQTDGTVVPTHALASRGSRSVCVHLRACVCACVSRLGSQGHLRHTIAHIWASTHTHTRSARALFLAPGKWKAPHNAGSLTLVTEEHFEYRLYFCHATLISGPFSPSCLTCTIPPWPPTVFFSAPSFCSCCLFFFCSHVFSLRVILCRKHIWNGVSLQKKTTKKILVIIP